MKKAIVVLCGLMLFPALAEVAPVYYDDVAEYAEEQADASEPVAEEVAVEEVKVVTPVSQPSRVSPRGASAASARAVRATNAVTNARNVATRNTAATRNATQARTAASHSAVNARTGASVATRSATTNSRVASRPSRSATTNSKAVTTRRAASANKALTARSGVAALETSSAPLYNARVGMRSSASIRARVPSAVSISSSTANVGTSTEEKQEAVMNMDELAQLTDYCKAQYTSCMDNFCNVLDDNQGRCSCSKNVKNYEKTELALKAATEALQDVSQQIQYIGLTADDIETLFTQTEAEIAMQSNSDNTQIKNDLDNIKDMIVGIKTGTATSSESGMSFDLSGLMNFNIDSTGFDLTGLFGGNTANTSSISNQRGEQLYKTAAARCKASVLTSCQAQGVDIAVVTNSYDLEIDRQCVAYERALTDSNENMNRTVRNAKVVLQKARLMVAQQKNAYDLRGCVNALDSCMQDDFVCGTDYENCLDPTGKYIVNGEVVIGSAPGYFVNNDIADAKEAAPIQHTKGLYATWNYKNDKDSNANAWYTADEDNPTTLAGYIAGSISQDAVTEMDSNLVRFLQYKIGYVKDNKTYGMCASVLNKCQRYTYDEGKFKNDNQVVREYLQRTLTQIKVAQDEIIGSYAENCISDVNSCLSSNNYVATPNYAINACKAQIVTCMSVNGDSTANPTPNYMKEWVSTVQNPEALVYVSFDLNGLSTGYTETNAQLFEGRVYNPVMDFALPTNSQTPETEETCEGGARYWCYKEYEDPTGESEAIKTTCKNLWSKSIPKNTKLASSVITLSCRSDCITVTGELSKNAACAK